MTKISEIKPPDNRETKEDLIIATLPISVDFAGWVAGQKGTAYSIWRRCDNLEWLMLLAKQRSPKVTKAFMERCIRQIKAAGVIINSFLNNKPWEVHDQDAYFDAPYKKEAVFVCLDKAYFALDKGDILEVSKYSKYALGYTKSTERFLAEEDESKFQIEFLHNSWEEIKTFSS